MTFYSTQTIEQLTQTPDGVTLFNKVQDTISPFQGFIFYFALFVSYKLVTLAGLNNLLKSIFNLCVLMCLMWFVIQNTISPFQGFVRYFALFVIYKRITLSGLKTLHSKKNTPITNNLTTASLTINH